MTVRRVLVVHTGGTLGMSGTPLEPGLALHRLLSDVPELNQLAKIESEVLCNLDSSDMNPGHWSSLARRIAERADDIDGFVVIHGTDTMAFTAAALAFALPGLHRPIVLTGAQRPLSALRTDARRNLVDAVEVATCGPTEVMICFDGQLLRGTRATKLDAEHYRAFDSPGVEPLGRLGLDLDLRTGPREPTRGPLRLLPDFDPAVAVAWATPAWSPASFDALAQSVRGVVLAAWGVGTTAGHLAPSVRRAVDAGIDVLVVSQAGGRIDLNLYPNGRALRDAGAISGGRMRVEAAVPKFMHALANIGDRAARRTWLATDVAGEAQ